MSVCDGGDLEEVVQKIHGWAPLAPGSLNFMAGRMWGMMSFWPFPLLTSGQIRDQYSIGTASLSQRNKSVLPSSHIVL